MLAVAPTGSGKTLAAFLWAIDRCLEPRRESGVRVLYVSPLKALAVDVERNLRAPLVGIRAQALHLGLTEPSVTVGLRTGDTPAQERRSMARRPPDVLITTPESLFLLLTSQARSMFAGVETVIVDEVHAIAGSKRGAHLAVSLARLDHLVGRPVPRVGLSATVRPTARAARFLGGDQPTEVVEVPATKVWDLQIQVPVEDLGDLSTAPATAGSDTSAGTSIWPHVENRIVDLIEGHRSTIVFANSRRLAERITARVNEIHAERTTTAGAGEGGTPVTAHSSTRPPAQLTAQSGSGQGAPAVLARAHHGSVSREQRGQIEDDLKTGRLRAVVATSSLELGIDMGAVDLVVQVESPPSVASGLQRVGRAGHQVGAVSRGVVLPKYRADLLSSAVVVDRMRSGAIEELVIPANPLDVVAQQVVACVAMDEWRSEDLLALLRRTAPFAELTPAVFEAVVEMLAGRYPSDAFAELRPRLVWDRDSGVLRARPSAQRLAVTSGGTIPDRGLFGVFVEGGGRVGELDEEMVYESRVGDSFALGATTWQITDITHDRVQVVPAPGAPARLPFWRGDNLGRPAELGAAIGAFTREVAQLGPVQARVWLAARGLDPWAAQNLAAYVAEQAEVSHVPTDRTIVVERTRDELGDWRITVLSPFGARVHAPWALIARDRLIARFGVDAAVLHGDDGIVARLPDVPDEEWLAQAVACLFPDPDDVAAEVTRLIGGSSLFAARFRECASRALLLPRPRPGRRAPLWQQRQRSAQLLQIAAEHPTFPIVLEAVRECLLDVYDLPALAELMASVQQRRVRVVEVTPAAASPFARSLLFGYVAEYLYEGDSPLAERRAAALTLDPALLGELLGQTDLRDLLEPDAIEQVVAQLQHLTEERRARGPEDAADLLRALGPLSTVEAGRRGVQADWLEDLARQRRIFPTRVAGADVWAPVEDAARLRDGLGAPIPPGLPDAHLRPVDDPLTDLVARFSRTHGPFITDDVVSSLGLPRAVVEERLAVARAAGRIIEGRFLADLRGSQWCHPDPLRMIKRRSVALLRHQIEPVSQSTLAAFLPSWQQVSRPGGAASLRRSEGVLDAIRILAGVPMPASALESAILPARVPDYRPAMLDALTSAGEVVWTGESSLPGGDAWVALAPAELRFLLPRSNEPPGSPTDRAVLDLLSQGGGWFAADIAGRLAGTIDASTSVHDALLELLWAGWVSNDTLEPVRAALSGARGRRSSSRRPPEGSHRPPRGRYADLWGRPSATRSPDSPGATRSRGQPQPGRLAGVRALPGRWFALANPAPDPAVVAVATAQAHLDRLGLVTRGAVAAAGDAGGFAAAYRTLALMEERGRVQRVYAVEGLGASQFALPGVVDQLRRIDRADASEDTDPLVLASTDPANAYGAALEWPSTEWAGPPGKPHRPSRSAGSTVVLVAGRPLLYAERGGRSLLTFAAPDDTDPVEWNVILGRAARALLESVRAGRAGPMTLTRINGLNAMDMSQSSVHPVRDALIVAGFTLTPSGYRGR